MRLNEFQESFKRTILEPDHLDNALFRNAFRQDHGICLENRMKVYRNNVIRSLIDAAMAALPMTEKLVGREFLEQAMRAFMVNNLPSQGNLNLYGIEFPDFIQTYELAKNLPYLQDFTRLEWLWEAAYNALDDLPLEPAELINIAEEDMPNLRFSFRKSFALLESAYPLDEIIDFCRAEDQDNLQQVSDRGCKLMIYRPDLKVELRRLDDAEYLFLSALLDGQTIHETAEILTESYPDADLTPLLQKHLQLGTFSGFESRR